MKRFYLLALICTIVSIAEMQAYDFTAPDVNGNTIYYAYLGGDSVKVTYKEVYDNSYSGDIIIPSIVSDGNTFYKVTTIGMMAFEESNSLTSIGIPSSIRKIGRQAFASCNALSKVNIEDIAAWCNITFDNINNTSNPLFYAQHLYVNNVEVTDLVIPNGITYIGDNAFFNCRGLTSITIPNSVTSIGKDAFYCCTGLTSLTIPNSVTSIGDLAFAGCYNLGSISVESENTTFDSRNDCNAIIETNSNTLIAGCKNTIIPNSVISIGNYAFYDCQMLTSIDIPNSVRNIGNSVFSYCVDLTSVTLPNSVISMGYNVFSNCRKLTSVLIPNSVTNTGSGLFQYCTSLTNVTLSNNISSIGSSFFRCDSSLTSVMIPNSVTSIGYDAFYKCSKLDTVICKTKTPPTLGSSVFYNISPTAVLLVPYESIEAYKAISGYADSFAEIKGFSDVEDITDTAATLKWIPDTAVVQYDINVYTADTLFAHYVVDGNGQIISSQRFAPSIYHLKMDTTVSSTEYFVISLDGLSAGTNYSYTIDGINAQSAPIYHEEGSFKTLNEDTEGLLDIISDDPRKQVVKILRDGQIFILRGDKIYTLTGQEVK